MPNTNETMSHPEFIRAWETSTSIRDVEEKTKTDFKRASNRATALRKRGVQLKRFNTRQRIDVAALEEFRKSLATEEA